MLTILNSILRLVANSTAWLDQQAKRIYELPGTSQRFVAMEGLRAYAALLVFMVHYFDAYGNQVLHIDFNTLGLAQSGEIKTDIMYYLFASHYGVDIFFLLSGFLIARMVSRPEFNYRHFLTHRLLRIYPAFLISLMIWAYIRIEVQGWYAFDPLQFIGNLLFLNALPQLGIKPYAMITWSLFYEFAFYLSFPVLVLLAGKHHRFHLPILGLLCALFMLTVFQFGDAFLRFLMFFGGVFIASTPQKFLIRATKWFREEWIIVAYLASTLWFAYLLSYRYFIPLFVLTTGLLTVQTLYGSGFLNRLFSWRPLRYLGNVSYSFYLLHALGIDLVMNYYQNLFSGLSGISYLIVTMTASLLAGLLLASLLFLVAEKPYFRKRLPHAVIGRAQQVPGL